jgi:cellulose synthase/poly-beta-1,6-N-acetylglucosamine synthase-like glycosyltransferase
MAAVQTYPVQVEASLDAPLSRGLWLVKWILVLPHYVVLAFLWLFFVVLTMVAMAAIVVTGRYPRAIFEFNVGVLRWTWRVQYYAIGAFGTDRYPPFTLADDPAYPAHLEVEYPQRLSRGLSLVKWWLLAIPHYLIIGVFIGGGLALGWLVGRPSSDASLTFFWNGWGLYSISNAVWGLIGLLAVIAALVLLVTGQYPARIFDVVLGLNRWVLRVACYAGLMTDQYPPFRLDTGGMLDGGAAVLAPSKPETAREQAGQSWIVQAVPGLLFGLSLVALDAALLIADKTGVEQRASKELTIGPVSVLIVCTTPSVMMVVAGVLTVVALILLVQSVDEWAARRVTDPARRPRQASRRPLRSEATSRRPAGRFSVTALIPARNEEVHLPTTLSALYGQTVPPDAVWVIADNCTDNTEDVARKCGANVYTTVNNRHRKAGGLNQLLARLLPTMGPFDAVLVMDADTIMVSDFIERAAAELHALPDLDAVGGVFYGDTAPGLLAQLQRNEYQRYGRDISRRKGNVFVLTGTASLFRADALAAVAASRGTVLPGEAGQVYDTFSLTEDNELTLALKTLGARLLSPRQCRVRTELMPTWRDLWHQRQRWQRGALENIGMYGFSSATARYWMQQLGLGYGVLALTSYLALTILSYLAFGLFVVVLFWVGIGTLFAVERTVTVWRGGWRARLLAIPLVIELVYALFLQAVYVKSLLDIATGRSKSWNAAKVTRCVS